MKRIIMPHPLVAPERLTWDPWAYSVGEFDFEPLDQTIDGWDYGTRLRVSSGVRVDLEGLIADLGPDVAGEAAVKFTLDCRKTGIQRSCLVPVRSADSMGHVVGRIDVEPQVLADAIVLIRQLVAMSGSAGGVVRAGSRLSVEDRRRASLEGVGGRFPMESFSFLNSARPHAPWDVAMDISDLGDAFTGCCVLYINADHPLASALVDPKAPQFAALTNMLYVDVVCRLLQTLATFDDLEEPADLDDASVWTVAQQICHLFLESSLQHMVQMWRDDPWEAQMTVRSRMRYLKELA